MSGSDSELEQRVAELEVQVAFQEDHLQKLNEALVEQQNRIDSLGSGLRHYQKRVQEIQEGIGEVSSENEVPPHY